MSVVGLPWETTTPIREPVTGVSTVFTILYWEPQNNLKGKRGEDYFEKTINI